MIDLLAEKSFALILEDVCEQIGEQRYSLWFANCKLKAMFRGTMSIGVPNVFFQDWVQSHYVSNIRFAIERVLGIAMKVEIVVDQELQSDLKNRIQDDSLDELLAESQGDTRARSLDDFVRVKENETAYRAVRHLVDNEAFGFNPLYIVGPEGVGKSHLSKGFRGFRGGLNPSKPRILEIDAIRFTKSFTLSLKTKRVAEFRAMFENLDVVVFDEVHRLKSKKATQQEFLHILRKLVQEQVQVVIVARHHPREIYEITDAFKSNLMSGMMVTIDSYHSVSSTKIVTENLARGKDEKGSNAFRDAAGSDVLRSLSKHCGGSIRELTAQLRRAHVLAYMKGERLTGKFVDAHLEEFAANSESVREIGSVFKAVCGDFDVVRSDLASKRKTKCLSLPRAVAACALRDYFGMTYKEVGQHLGGRSHTSVYVMIKKYRPIVDEHELAQVTLARIAKLARSQPGAKK